jgi:2-polyprenyl-3-methyl-5-hydroxy-6-metoxy-1,4-benzoquinol methylase
LIKQAGEFERIAPIIRIRAFRQEVAMERAEWLKHMQIWNEMIYDHISPQYWVNFGFYRNETHMEFLGKFLDRLPPQSMVLSAACGAGRYDGILLEAGHHVIGIDQSAGMLQRAREHFPQAKYDRMALQEMNFSEQFEGAVCIDAMEHVCPEDWPGILTALKQALKPDGLLYITVEIPEASEVEASYQRSKAMGLPVVYGEMADDIQASYERVIALAPGDIDGEAADVSVYHYHPSLEKVRAWLDDAQLAIEAQGTGHWYEHFLVRKKN